MEDILDIKDLHTYFYSEDSVIKAVEGLNLQVKKGEVLGLVGESACGKSVSALSVLRLIQHPGRIVKGKINFEGKDLLNLSERQMQSIRGKEISIIFQEPGSALNPVYTVGFQVAEMIKTHNPEISRKDIKNKVLGLLQAVELSESERIIKSYPHTLSGGQAQRVMISMAVACNPKLLIADEPTTALDVTIQAQIMSLFAKIKKQTNLSFILISHDLRLCRQSTDRIAIMYAGKIVEEAPTNEVFSNPLHPYTQSLLASLPGDKQPKERFTVISGRVPNPADKPAGCHFRPRCTLAGVLCESVYPEFIEVNPGHFVSCHKVK